jgi:hypothetical protein
MTILFTRAILASIKARTSPKPQYFTRDGEKRTLNLRLRAGAEVQSRCHLADAQTEILIALGNLRPSRWASRAGMIVTETAARISAGIVVLGHIRGGVNLHPGNETDLKALRRW